MALTPKEPPLSWEDLTPLEQWELQLAPLTLGLLCVWFYSMFLGLP